MQLRRTLHESPVRFLPLIEAFSVVQLSAASTLRSHLVKDAVACFIETEVRHQHGRHSPLEGRLCVKTDSWGRQGTKRQCS